MEDTLKEFLTQRDYVRVKLKLTKTNHFEIKARINNIPGLFILDTGASSSCVGFKSIEHFQLIVKDSKIKAAGAGAIGMFTQISKNNILKIGRWKKDRISLILFDLNHVNQALKEHNAQPVHGIIGADILKQVKAIIDYDKKYLYLRKGLL